MADSWAFIIILVSTCSCLVSPILIAMPNSCKLDHKYIEDSNRIVFHKDQNNNFKLLLRDKVYFNEHIYLACGNSNFISSVQCNRHGQFVPLLPRHCSVAPKAKVIHQKTVGVDNFYSVGYAINANIFLELYHAVYNPSGVSAKYVQYTSYTGNTQQPRPKQDFTQDGVISGEDAASFQNDNIHKRFNALFNKKQKYILNGTYNVIERGHLAPSADFLYDYDMRATFKFINVAPQFGAINRANWKMIEDWVRALPQKRPRDDHIEYHVVTGVLDVLSLENKVEHKSVQTFLEKGKRNPLPKWIYKVVHKQGVCTVFLLYNNIYATKLPQATCKVVQCPNVKNLHQHDWSKGLTYCCDAQDFKRKYLPNVNIC